MSAQVSRRCGAAGDDFEPMVCLASACTQAAQGFPSGDDWDPMRYPMDPITATEPTLEERIRLEGAGRFGVGVARRCRLSVRAIFGFWRWRRGWRQVQADLVHEQYVVGEDGSTREAAPNRRSHGEGVVSALGCSACMVWVLGRSAAHSPGRWHSFQPLARPGDPRLEPERAARSGLWSPL